MQVVQTTAAALLPVLGRLLRLLRQESASHGLSSVATAVLGRLDREGPQRLTDLARSEATSQPGMTQLVARLHKEGLVRRTAHPSDGRAAMVEITEGGRDLLARSQARHAATLEALLEALSPADRALVEAAVPALARMVEAAG